MKCHYFRVLFGRNAIQLQCIFMPNLLIIFRFCSRNTEVWLCSLWNASALEETRTIAHAHVRVFDMRNFVKCFFVQKRPWPQLIFWCRDNGNLMGTLYPHVTTQIWHRTFLSPGSTRGTFVQVRNDFVVFWHMRTLPPEKKTRGTTSELLQNLCDESRQSQICLKDDLSVS